MVGDSKRGWSIRTGMFLIGLFFERGVVSFTGCDLLGSVPHKKIHFVFR